MPGESFEGELDPLMLAETEARDLLERHVRELAEKIGPRDVRRHEALDAAAEYIASEFERPGRAACF